MLKKEKKGEGKRTNFFVETKEEKKSEGTNDVVDVRQLFLSQFTHVFVHQLDRTRDKKIKLYISPGGNLSLATSPPQSIHPFIHSSFYLFFIYPCFLFLSISQ